MLPFVLRALRALRPCDPLNNAILFSENLTQIRLVCVCVRWGKKRDQRTDQRMDKAFLGVGFCFACFAWPKRNIRKFSWFCFIQVWKWKALSPNSVSEMWMKISFTYEWFFYEIKEHWDQSMYRHHSNVWNQCFCSNQWSLWLRVRLFISNTSSQVARVNIQHAQVWVASPSIIWLDKLMMKMWSAIWGGEGAQLMDFGSHTHSLLVASHWLLTIQWCLYGKLKW